MGAGQPQEAVAVLRQWPGAASDWESQWLLASAHVALRDLDQAEAALEQSVVTVPDERRGEAYRRLAQIAMARKDYSRAREHLERSLAVDPTDLIALETLGGLPEDVLPREALRMHWADALESVTDVRKRGYMKSRLRELQ